jgi:pre-rRNA-processing protein TSR3
MTDEMRPRVVVIRHRKERKSKCSLQPLVSHPDFVFYSHDKPERWTHLPGPAPGSVRLDFTGPPISAQDAAPRLLIVDGTWRYAGSIGQHPKIALCQPRSLLEDWKTAYPRRQTLCQDPEKGLASVEALFAAFLQMGKLEMTWLDHYYWKQDFLNKNATLINWLCERKGFIC